MNTEPAFKYLYYLVLFYNEKKKLDLTVKKKLDPDLDRTLKTNFE